MYRLYVVNKLRKSQNAVKDKGADSSIRNLMTIAAYLELQIVGGSANLYLIFIPYSFSNVIHPGGSPCPYRLMNRFDYSNRTSSNTFPISVPMSFSSCGGLWLLFSVILPIGIGRRSSPRLSRFPWFSWDFFSVLCCIMFSTGLYFTSRHNRKEGSVSPSYSTGFTTPSRWKRPASLCPRW